MADEKQKRILVIVSDGVEDIETVAPLDIMNWAGYEVTVAGLTSPTIEAAYAVTLTVDTTLEKVNGEFDAIVLPGGKKNAEQLAADYRVVELVRSQFERGKLVAAICASSGYVLAEAAGILRGKQATCHPTVNDKLVAAGATVSNELVTVDDNVITGMGPGAAIPFGLAIVEYLSGAEAAEEIARMWWIAKAPAPLY